MWRNCCSWEEKRELQTSIKAEQTDLRWTKYHVADCFFWLIVFSYWNFWKRHTVKGTIQNLNANRQSYLFAKRLHQVPVLCRGSRKSHALLPSWASCLTVKIYCVGWGWQRINVKTAIGTGNCSAKFEFERNLVFGWDFLEASIDWVPWFSVQMCPHFLAFTTSKLVGGQLAEVGNFWLNSRGVPATVRKSCQPYIKRPAAVEPKSLKTPKNDATNQRYSVILYWSTCIGRFEGHLVYSGEISEQRSFTRETDREQRPWRITQGVACDVQFGYHSNKEMKLVNPWFESYILTLAILGL